MKKQLIVVLAGLLALPLAANPRDFAGDGRTPAEHMIVYDPLEIERKEPSFWWRPSEQTPEAQLVLAQRYEAEDRLKKARNAYNDLVHAWHSAPEAVTAQQAIARIYEKQGKYQDAYDENIYLLAHFSGQFPLDPILDKTFKLANLLAENRRGWFGIDLIGANALRENYQRIIHFAPRWQRAPEVLLRIGALYESDGRYTEALATYSRILTAFPETQLKDDIIYRVCESLLKLAKSKSQDSEKLKECENRLALMIRSNPKHPGRDTFEEWQQEIYAMRRELSYNKAKFYDNRKYSAAVTKDAYAKFLSEFPDAPQRDAIAARLTELAPSAAQ